MLKRLFSDVLARRWRRGAGLQGSPAGPADPFEAVGKLILARKLDAAQSELAIVRSELPGDERGLFMHAEILRLQGRFADAMPEFRSALLGNPKRVDAWIGLGDCSVRAGDELQACIYYRTALSLDPERADVLNELGLIALARGNYTEATELFDQTVNIDAQHAEGWNNSGLVAASHGKVEKARRCFHRAAHLRPGFYTALCNLGLACRNLGRLDEASEALERATASNPDRPAAWVNLASLRQDQGRMVEARVALERAVGMSPDDVGVLTAYGALLAKLGDIASAGIALSKALELAPDDPEANLAQAHLDLICGRYAEGWDRYDARLRAVNSPRRRFPFPEWDGRSAAGKVLLIYAEQGLGDTLMFASCLPDLMREARAVILHCEDRLWPLMQRSFPGLERYNASARNAVDAYAPIGSLPRIYRRNAEAFPRHAGYLRAAPEAHARAVASIGAEGVGIKAGIAWRGGIASTGRAMRSLDLADLRRLLGEPGVRWFNLQHGDVADEIADLKHRSGIVVNRLDGVESDIDAAAAAISALDTVVTVCSSIAHLAGALGKPTVVLTPHVPAWRYLLTGDAMPWYPSITLLRQPSPGEWSPVLEAASRRLSAARV